MTAFSAHERVLTVAGQGGTVLARIRDGEPLPAYLVRLDDQELARRFEAWELQPEVRIEIGDAVLDRRTGQTGTVISRCPRRVGVSFRNGLITIVEPDDLEPAP